MRTWFQQWLLMIPGVLLAGYVIDGIRFDDPLKLVLVAAVLSLLNLVARPVLIFFALPFVLLTLGLGIFLINALLLYFAGWLVPGFWVASFPIALLASLLVSFVNFVVVLLLGPKRTGRQTRHVGLRIDPSSGPRGFKRKTGKDVIDV